jgi:hypothetical protein
MLRVLVFITAMFCSMTVTAVSCGGAQSLNAAFDSASDIFSARLVNIYSAPGFGRGSFRFANLRILRVWKGSLKPGDIVSTTAEDSINFVSDGFIPPQDKDVLIFTNSPQPFILSACSRSQLLDGTDDLRKLDKLARQDHHD